MKVKKHNIGSWGGGGSVFEYGDGTAEYRRFLKVTPSFKVRIADVTGVSVLPGPKFIEKVIKIVGNGTELASAVVTASEAMLLEEWFRSHPDFGGSAKPPAPASTSVADELSKLASLHDAGILTDEEFHQQKAKLLG